MGRKKRKTSASGAPALDRQSRRLRKMEQALDELASGLVRMDPKTIERVVKEIETYPTAALRILLKRLASDDAATQAVAERVLASCTGANVIDNLKATVFDVSASDQLKVRANELLAEVDAPIDPDVLEMSVANARELAQDLPGRIYDAVAAGDMDGAKARFQAVDLPHQLVMTHRVGAGLPEQATEFFQSIMDQGEAIHEAILWALSHHARADAVDLVVELAGKGSKSVQKAAKRALFALKAAGAEVPEPSRPEPKHEEPDLPDDQLPVHSAMVGRSERQEGGPTYVSLARLRPNGRLKVLILVVDPWTGIRLATFRPDLSKSAYERALKATPADMPLRESSEEEIRNLVARGFAATKVLGAAIPLDFQLGRSLLGLSEDEIASTGFPFRCTGCGASLGEEVVGQVRDSLVYRHVKIEKRCEACRVADGKKAGEA